MRMSNNELDSYFEFSDKKVEIPNRNFSDAIQSFSSAELDEPTVQVLFEASKSSLAAPDVQERIRRFLSAADSL